MAYVECTECGFRANANLGFVAQICPRCLARQRGRVPMQEFAGSLRNARRFERARTIRDADLREAHIKPAEE